MTISELICSAERNAAELMLEARDIIAVSKTDARNVVTQYDKKIQDYLTECFLAAFPDAQFCREESDDHDELTAEHVFIIDPIDGTMNFVKGFHQSCISVAYMSYGEVMFAAVYNPYYDEMFTAEKGKGAFLNRKPIHVDDCGIGSGLACVGMSPYARSSEFVDENFRYIRKIYDAAFDIRREGSAELDLCSIACGKAAFYYELELSFWDYAAGLLIVTEAGGIALTVDGKELPKDGSKSSVIAGGRKAVDDFLKL